jgi:acyl-CoA synthetase (AMP-forming)/AMP-acid ligase II
MNIVEPILFQARYQPEAPALCAQGIDVISYARLVAQMSNIARRAMSFGLKRGNVVIVSIDEPMLHAAVILGLTQVGIIPVSLVMKRPSAGLKIDAVISNAGYPFAPEAQHLIIDFSWIMGNSGPVETVPAGGDASDEVCRIILTSATTGDPKAVALTHKLAMARNARFQYLLGNRLPTYSRFYMNMGLAAARGYYFLTQVLGRGGAIFFRGDSTENTLRSFEIFQMQAMLAAPNTLVQLLADCDRHPSIEVHFDTIVTGGSVLPLALIERIRPRLCSHLVTVYGATETTLAATAPAHRIAHIPGAVGYVTPGARIAIVDEADRPVPVGTEGIVRIASEFSVDRYIDDPIESAKVFRSGWFYPGDLGSLTADNLLIISGRMNDVLNIGGGKSTVEKVESFLSSFSAVGEVAVFVETNALGIDELWAAVVWRDRPDAENLREYCRQRMPPHFIPAHIVTLDALPVGATGKVDRLQLKQMLAPSAQS